MKLLPIILIVFAPLSCKSQCPETKDIELLKNIAELDKKVIPTYWQEWRNVPMTLLLVTDQKEYLFNHRPKDESFELVCDSIYSRNRTQSINLLAAFPLVDWLPTIVVGKQENTNTSSLEHWVLTVLHEHFHQFQYSQPEYFTESNLLDLAKDENDFMWQLNYPFPYENVEVEIAIKKMNGVLLEFLESESPDLSSYLQVKNELKSVISDKDYRYLNFQLWQEGFSRFVEMKLLSNWIENYEDIGIQQFSKTDLEQLAENYAGRVKEDLRNGKSSKMKRVIFYSMGAAEAKLIETINPEWQQDYFNNLFNTDALLIK